MALSKISLGGISTLNLLKWMHDLLLCILMYIRNVKQNWNAIFFIRIYADVGDWKNWCENLGDVLPQQRFWIAIVILYWPKSC